jgi:hypothetical protein
MVLEMPRVKMTLATTAPDPPSKILRTVLKELKQIVKEEMRTPRYQTHPLNATNPI